MSVMVVTSLGDIVIDLHTDRCPLTTKNFLKLCKIKYFNGCLFHTVQKDFTAQTGDPTGKGTGGDSVYKFLYGDQARFFSDEIHPDLTHSKIGTVAMASAGENLNASQFYFTLRDNLDYLDEKHTVFGEVAEGIDTLTRINEAYVDEKGRPYKNIRIKHTYILDDPFEDPSQLAELIPERSPEGKPHDEVIDVRLEDDWVPMDETLGPAELEEALRAKEAESNAVFLETVGDIPDAEIKPPENVLFVCKLNPVTQDEDLDTIFSRFGTVLSAEVIRDFKTGDSLCYAFIEFETTEACERAYFKMDNALIDDRRIHVDFSQSVAKLWSQYRRGKGNQSGKGRGCFKCGAVDHIAKDCTEGSNTNRQNPKYILKDDNTQRGGDGHHRYEMLFEDDTQPNMDHGKRRHGHEIEDVKKQRRENGRSPDAREHRDRNMRDYEPDRERHDHRQRDHKRSQRRDYEHEKNSGERAKEGMEERDSSRRRMQDKQDQKKRSPSRSEDQEGRRRKHDSISRDDERSSRDEKVDRRSRDGKGDRSRDQKGDRSRDPEVHRGNSHKGRDIDNEGGRGAGQRADERSPHKVVRRNDDRKRTSDEYKDSSYRKRDDRDDRKWGTDYYSTSDRKHDKERR